MARERPIPWRGSGSCSCLTAGPRRPPPIRQEFMTDPESLDISSARSAAWMAAIVESSDDAIISKSLRGTILSWNPSATRIFGWTAEEAIGKHITLIIPPERHDEE